MTIESAYADFVAKTEDPELGRTCLTRAVDAALTTQCISPELVDRLRGKEVSLPDSCAAIVDEIYGGKGSGVQVLLEANTQSPDYLADRRFFASVADVAMRGNGIVVVWTEDNHVEALLPAAKCIIPGDQMRTNDDLQWALSDQYFATRYANPDGRYRAYSLEEVWGKMAEFPGGYKQLLVLQGQKNTDATV